MDAAASFPDATTRRLFAEAASSQWNTEHALDWSALSFDRLAPPTHRAMATVYADVLYAEEFGLHLVLRMTELAPEGWLREFARIQVVDELRHRDFFGRVTAKLGGAAEPSPELAVLRAELERCVDYDELLLHGQIMETAARVVFVGNGTRTLQALDRGVRLPGSEAAGVLLRAVVRLVGSDESRHIAFGQHCLKLRLAAGGPRLRKAFEERAAVSARLMYSAFARRSREFTLLGTPAGDVLDRTWRALEAQLARLELGLGSAAAPSV